MKEKDDCLVCVYCGSLNASNNRQKTEYHNECDNMKVLCPDCQREEDEYWDDMWVDYYSSVL